MEDNMTVRTEDIGVKVETPVTTQDVKPLNCEAAFSSFSEAEKQEIMALADAIDVTKVENVMNYGSEALRATFEQCGKFLKDERGSYADQEVIKRVIELSKRASESYDDFNLVLQEPNMFQKIMLQVIGIGKKSRTEKIQQSAITNYKLLSELKASCDSWLEMLKKAMGDIEYSAISDAGNIALLEKYIIAGKIAEERIASQMAEIHQKYNETGLQQYVQEYDEMKEGNNIFLITMTNLEKSRIMYHLSIGQLSLIKRANRNVQISIHTQVDNSMALIGQQLRNAVLDAKTREVLEGQKAISRLNDELIKDVSKNVGLTAEETEKLLYASFYHTDAAKEAITTVINSCNAIQKTATEMLPQMKADLTQLNELIQQLEPCIGSIETSETSKSGNLPTTGGSKLKF